MLWNTSSRSKAKSTTNSKKHCWVANILSLRLHPISSGSLGFYMSTLEKKTKRNRTKTGSKSSRGDHHGGHNWSTEQLSPLIRKTSQEEDNTTVSEPPPDMTQSLFQQEEGECSDNSLTEQDHKEDDSETTREREKSKAVEHRARPRHRFSQSQGHCRRGTISGFSRRAPRNNGNQPGQKSSKDMTGAVTKYFSHKTNPETIKQTLWFCSAKVSQQPMGVQSWWRWPSKELNSTDSHQQRIHFRWPWNGVIIIKITRLWKRNISTRTCVVVRQMFRIYVLQVIIRHMNVSFDTYKRGIDTLAKISVILTFWTRRGTTSGSSRRAPWNNGNQPSQKSSKDMTGAITNFSPNNQTDPKAIKKLSDSAYQRSPKSQTESWSASWQYLLDSNLPCGTRIDALRGRGGNILTKDSEILNECSEVYARLYIATVKEKLG